MAITPADDSASIGSTEFFLFSASTTATYETTPAIVHAFLDVSEVTAGDSFRLRVYETIDGSDPLVVYEATIVGAQPGPYVFPALVLCNGYEYSVQKLAGTDRTIAWSLRTVA
jgi:hypothetical protein